MQPTAALLDEAWIAVAGVTPRPDITITGRPGALPAVLPVHDIAVVTVATALGAAATIGLLPGSAARTSEVDREHVADAMRSERLFRIDGQPAGASFALLSRFWRTADGFVRTHANYAWHRDALLTALELPADAGPDAVSERVAERTAGEVEETVFARGGVAVQVRTPSAWADHPQGAAVRDEPLVSHTVFGSAAPRARPRGTTPADGLRVLDLTRVIAGPVCTRFLGALGADVLRIDPPDHDDIPPGMYADTLLGKRSAVLDLNQRAAVVHELLDRADILVCGYRPGSLDRFALTDDDLAERHPGLVVVRLAAWGHTGPWRHRRGFDSVVQAAVGIADTESRVQASRDVRASPGALPCQLLDHGTGYLAAAAALDGLRRQADDGGTVVRRVSLARTAAWLLAAQREPASVRDETSTRSWLAPVGPVDAVAPPGSIDGRPLRWPEPPARFLADEPVWT